MRVARALEAQRLPRALPRWAPIDQRVARLGECEHGGAGARRGRNFKPLTKIAQLHK